MHFVVGISSWSERYLPQCSPNTISANKTADVNTKVNNQPIIVEIINQFIRGTQSINCNLGKPSTWLHL